jgi:hypothetical protein
MNKEAQLYPGLAPTGGKYAENPDQLPARILETGCSRIESVTT